MKIIIVILLTFFSQTIEACRDIDFIVEKTLKDNHIDSIVIDYYFPKYSRDLVVCYRRSEFGCTASYYYNELDSLRAISLDFPRHLTEEQFTVMMLESVFFKQKDIYSYKKKMPTNCESDEPILRYRIYKKKKKKKNIIFIGDPEKDQEQWIGFYSVKYTDKFMSLIKTLHNLVIQTMIR